MAEIYFEKNIVIEFLCSLVRFAREEEVKEKHKENSYKLHEEIEKWIVNTEGVLSNYLKSEIKFLFSIFNTNPMIMFNFVTRNKIISIDELLVFFSNLNEEEYIRVFKEEISIEEEKGQEDIKDKLSLSHDSNEVTAIIEMLENPKETIYRLRYVLDRFYNIVFKKEVAFLQDFLELKLKEHNNKFREMESEFTRAVVAMDRKVLDNYPRVIFYVSYFIESGAFVLEFNNNELIIIYGFNREYRLNDALINEKKKLLFKVLSDEKRVEILRLISERQWYGNELAKHLGVTTATLSYHMSRLLDIGVVNIEEGESNRFYYKCDKEKLKEIFHYALMDIISQ